MFGVVIILFAIVIEIKIPCSLFRPRYIWLLTNVVIFLVGWSVWHTKILIRIKADVIHSSLFDW